jgi:hypothetical protein
MIAETTYTSFRSCLLLVLSRIRQTAQSRKVSELPTAEFSNALNTVGEYFVHLLLNRERKGQWWLGDNGEFVECKLKNTGSRNRRNFVRGQSAEWAWFPQSASRLADPMTQPDHLVTLEVPSLSLTANVALEQKLRFGTPQDAFANSATYVKHLLAGLTYPLPDRNEFNVDSYCHGLLEAAKAFICKIKRDGKFAYSGSVPHVCFVSVGSSPNTIVVQEKLGGATTVCNFVGFLPPCVNTVAFTKNTPYRQLVLRAKVRLWMGLDSLLEQCNDEEVELAWTTAIDSLTTSIRNPKWDT